MCLSLDRNDNKEYKEVLVMYEIKYNEETGLYDVWAQGVKVSSTGTIEAAKLSLDFYKNVYYNPLYNDQFGLRRN